MISRLTFRAVLAGAFAGMISALAFTVLHGVMINSIWFMAVPMLVAGALCGMFLAWEYVLLFDTPTVRGWIRYNILYLILLFSLGLISLLVFEPVITIPALIASPNGLPVEMVREVTPLVIIYTVVMALLINLLCNRRWSAFPVVLAATAVIMVLLGLNVATIGLVFLTNGWLSMLLELLILILTLNFVYALAFIVLGYDWLWTSQRQIIST